MVNEKEIQRLIMLELDRLTDIQSDTTKPYIERMNATTKYAQHVIDSLSAGSVYDTLVTLGGFFVQCYENQKAFFSDPELARNEREVLQSVHEEIVRIVTTWSASYLQVKEHAHLR